MTQLVLSCFPGIGLLDRAFEAEGFVVVRGPDCLWGGDIREFHPPAGKFDGVIGGPPCQAFSRLQKLVEHNRKKHPDKYALAENLIPEFERVIGEARPRWFLMENVPDAPMPSIDGYFLWHRIINNRWVGGEQNRKRRFCFGTTDGTVLDICEEALEPARYTPAICASGSTWVPVRIGGSGKLKGGGRVYGDKSEKYLKLAIKAQGLPEDFLDKSPFTVRGKVHAIGNGVPIPMGRAVAKAVRKAIEGKEM